MKKLICLLFAIAALSCTVVYGYSDKALDYAKKLYDLGLFKGNGDSFSAEDMNLDDNATRVQIAVTITRMLGKEDKAVYQKNAHSFSDVPAWASDYVGYLYENYLVNGISNTKFGSNDTASVRQFSTMLLRVLGYSDGNGGDFTYENANDFAKKIGLIDDTIYGKDNLIRADMVQMCYTALNLPIKNSHRTLGMKLLNEKVFTRQQAKEAGITISNMLQRAFSDIPCNLPSFTAEQASDTTIVLKLDDYIEHYGVRVFLIRGKDDVMLEAPYTLSNGYGIEKGKISYLGGGAGYINEIIVTVPDANDSYRFMVLKTSSESANCHYLGKSHSIDYNGGN